MFKHIFLLKIFFLNKLILFILESVNIILLHGELKQLSNQLVKNLRRVY